MHNYFSMSDNDNCLMLTIFTRFTSSDLFDFTLSFRLQNHLMLQVLIPRSPLYTGYCSSTARIFERKQFLKYHHSRRSPFISLMTDNTWEDFVKRIMYPVLSVMGLSNYSVTSIANSCC